ncbi:metal ABC transporter solute-binding protein, Zn/Mn family [Cylindrospermopsis raciborskii]|uniref:metal ABC transporter solute-binding protein, Zn/Mn family n=1 Tax=Cylindrospermopsis raciborskii TaxID=77022 RepID=UPI0038D0CECF
MNKLLNFKFCNICLPIGLPIILAILGCNHRNLNNNYTQDQQNQKISQNLPQVLVTTTILCDITNQIAKESINLICLVPPGLEPPIYQPTPEDIKAIKKADLILYHGYNFEPNLIKSFKNSRKNIAKISVGQRAVKQPQKLRQNGKIINEPHIWHDVRNAIKMVEVVNFQLGKISPENQQRYNSNTRQLTRELKELNQWIKSTLSTIPDKKRKLLTTHGAMIYYVKAYGLDYKGTLPDISNEDKLTAKKAKSLAEYIKTTQAPIIFADRAVNLMLLAPIAKKTKVKIFPRPLYIDGLGEPGSDGETYQKMMDANTRSIVEGLGGTYLRFAPNIGR